MEQKVTLYDIAGNAIKPGDTIIQYLGRSRSVRSGTVRELRAGKDGRLRVVADGDFKRVFLPGILLNVSALGVPTEREQRPEVWPDMMREYNGYHVTDVLGYEARAHDQVLFWYDSKHLCAGTIRSFGDNSMVATVPARHEGEVVQYITVKDRNFIIYEGDIPVPEELLFRKKPRQQRAKSTKKKETHKKEIDIAVAFMKELSQLYGRRENEQIAEEDFQTSVKELMVKFDIQGLAVDI